MLNWSRRNYIVILLILTRKLNKNIRCQRVRFSSNMEKRSSAPRKNRTLFIIVKQPLKVIALGGGAFLQEEIRQYCLDHSIVFYLDISWESWKERLHMLVDSRPVLQNKSMEEIEALFQERKAIYNEHNSRFVTDDTKSEEVADYIIHSLKLAWDIYA